MLNLNQNNSLGFGYKSPLKDIVDICAYTGKKLSRRERTVEHIKPHSRGGSNSLKNYLITAGPINMKRGNMRFDKWLKNMPEVVENIQKYLDKSRGLKINEKNYVEEVKVTLNREARGVVVFHGNKATRLDARG
ncbi:MAG: hypothetical protein A2Y25_11130 [Candidatus Melainabacteria bacterium GWF2_37_15]|nr:MAG: hypothetical protein A2Y25_11130 [Candidatus Melainabacteria bacterium GWF2_37_15]